jgi:hypothetical protein
MVWFGLVWFGLVWFGIAADNGGASWKPWAIDCSDLLNHVQTMGEALGTAMWQGQAVDLEYMHQSISPVLTTPAVRQALARLCSYRHPYLLGVWGIITSSDHCKSYVPIGLVVPQMPCGYETLASRIATKGALQIAEAARIIEHMMRAIVFAQSKSCIGHHSGLSSHVIFVHATAPSLLAYHYRPMVCVCVCVCVHLCSLYSCSLFVCGTMC